MAPMQDDVPEFVGQSVCIAKAAHEDSIGTRMGLSANVSARSALDA